MRSIARKHGIPLFQEPSIPVCYAANGSSFVVRSDGRINKCTVALDEECNQVGRLAEDGTLNLDVGRMCGWIRGAVDADAKALLCPLKGWKEPSRV
jgi:uncharacterized protein